MTDELRRAQEAIKLIVESLCALNKETWRPYLYHQNEAQDALLIAVKAARAEGVKEGRRAEFLRGFNAADDVCREETIRIGFLRALDRVEELMAGHRDTGVSLVDVLDDLRKEINGERIVK